MFFYEIFFLISNTFSCLLNFFFLECIFKRFHTYSMKKIKGIFFKFRKFSIITIIIFLIYSGIPGTIKFTCEFYLFCNLFEFSFLFCFFSSSVSLGLFSFTGFCCFSFSGLYKFLYASQSCSNSRSNSSLVNSRCFWFQR